MSRYFHFPPVAILLGIALAGCSTPPTPPAKKTEVAPPATKILNFYTSTPVITRGDAALLCYGIEGTGPVKLEPPIETLSPALARCFEVKPTATTRYTLSVPNTSQSVEVRVQPQQPKPAQLIQFFAAGAEQAKPGDSVMLCFGVTGAKSVRLSPGGTSYPPAARMCISQIVERTTRFTLEVEGQNGAKATESLQITVKP